MPPPSSTSPEPAPLLSSSNPGVPSHLEGGEIPAWSTDATDESGPVLDEPSSTPSTEKGGGLKVSKIAIRAAIGGGFRQLAKVLGAYLATELEREAGVWTPDDEDVKDISTPAASLLFRRIPDVAKTGDVVDLFSLGSAITAYVAKNMRQRKVVRTAVELQALQGIDVSADAT
ncbi:hypothetical protein ABZ341_41690 [Streptomyces sp. NPDC006173]|uniref:hypothetical protein n=1 Tax=Streptomyces sp. NPDC006173 TaxID=3155349 RepID=UPI0033F208DB